MLSICTSQIFYRLVASYSVFPDGCVQYYSTCLHNVLYSPIDIRSRLQNIFSMKNSRILPTAIEINRENRLIDLCASETPFIS